MTDRTRRRMLRVRSIEDLRRAAQRRLPAAVFDFFDGGSEDEVTLRDNRAAFDRRRLLPRVLRGVSSIDTATTIAGAAAKSPIVIAPTGAAGFGRPGADVAIARSAAAFGIPYTLSSSATASIERIAREAPGRLWFQPYILRDQAFFRRLIDRAEAAGYEALVVTVDMPVGGKRERDYRRDFAIPFAFTLRNVLDFASRPRWALGLARHGVPVLENLVGLARSGSDTAAIASSVGRDYDSGFDWQGLQSLRERWRRRLLVKGILHPEDALRAAAIGCDGVIVSNHGGRQLDGAVASIDAVPAIAAAVGNRIEVLMDGGVRRGSDIVKALALGARAVMIGRATLYGASAAGEAGARRALEILTDELARTMRLCGTRTIAEIDPRVIA
ncbi:MAG: alpha-hydroxy acid oxidase [Casimicrobiaceae bacterium]